MHVDIVYDDGSCASFDNVVNGSIITQEEVKSKVEEYCKKYQLDVDIDSLTDNVVSELKKHCDFEILNDDLWEDWIEYVLK